MKMFIVFLILIILNCRPENKTANLWPLLLVGSQSNVRQNTSTTTGTGSGTSTTTGTGSGTSTTPGKRHYCFCYTSACNKWCDYRF